MDEPENSIGRFSETCLCKKRAGLRKVHLVPDHVHMLVLIPQKYSVSRVAGFIKGKSAIQIARTFLGHKRNFTGQSFWAKGYFVSTVDRDERGVRE